MKKSIMFVAIAAALGTSAVSAQSTPSTTITPEPTPAATSWFNPIALPGSTWGSITYPGSVLNGSPEENDVIFQGNVEQGADWFKFGDRKQFTFNTFVSMPFTVDSDGLPWNNKIQPGVGMKVRHNWGDSGVTDIGVRALYESRWKDNQSGWGYQLFVNYYTNWDLKRK